MPVRAMDDAEGRVPGAFPSAAEESVGNNRTPKKRFVGRRTAEAQAKQREDEDPNSTVEESAAIVQQGTRQPSSAV